MPTINNLSTVTTVTSGDLVPIYSQSNGDARAASMSTILGYVEDNFASPDFSTVTAAPTSGFTETLDAATTGIWLILSPAGTLASGTIVLPGPTDCFDGQTVIVTSSQAITSLTVNGNGGTVNGAPTSLAANGFFQLRYYALTTTWWCVAQSLGGTGTLINPVINGSLLSPDSEVMLAFVQSDVGTAVNYLTLVYSITGDGVGFVATGADTDISFNITGKGAGGVNVTAGSGDLNVTSGSGTASLRSGSGLAEIQGATVEITSVGVCDISTGSGGFGIDNVFRQMATTVGALPSPLTVFAGARHFVTDSNATLAAGLGNIVAGGGANNVPVYSDGTNWRIG